MFGRALVLLQLHASSTASCAASHVARITACGSRHYSNMVDRASLAPRGTVKAAGTVKTVNDCAKRTTIKLHVHPGAAAYIRES